ncbi:MAG: hypothetical protein P4L86_30140 [Mycobacterium sp.]|nr:hypothetical protein [Mycobacterium sp.]
MAGLIVGLAAHHPPGMPKFPDDAAVDEQLDREILAAAAPPERLPTEVA